MRHYTEVEAEPETGQVFPDQAGRNSSPVIGKSMEIAFVKKTGNISASFADKTGEVIGCQHIFPVCHILRKRPAPAESANISYLIVPAPRASACPFLISFLMRSRPSTMSKSSSVPPD